MGFVAGFLPVVYCVVRYAGRIEYAKVVFRSAQRVLAILKVDTLGLVQRVGHVASRF